MFSSLIYPASNAHVPPYCHPWPVQLNNIFSHNLINATKKKKLTEQRMCVLIFSTTFIRNISHSTNWVRDDQKCILVLMYSTSYSHKILTKLEFSPLIFKKYSKYQISRKSNQWDLSCPKRTDWQTNIMKLRDAFRNSDNMPKNNETSVWTSCNQTDLMHHFTQIIITKHLDGSPT